jgi:DNA-binding LytR/AlgR family response regulator
MLIVRFCTFLESGEKMNIAVCEDNAKDAALICGCLREHFDKYGYVGEIQAFDSGEALLAAFSGGAFDAVFLDIYMGGMTGLETAKKMRDVDSSFALIFITSSKAHALEAFGLRACAYVPKPVERGGINLAFEQCRSVFIKNARFIKVTSGRETIKIPLVRIYYAEVYGNNVLIYTGQGVIETRMTLDELEKGLGEQFLRCHRSHIVNLNYVEKVLEHDILMRNGDKVPMRQRGRMEIRDAHATFISDQLFEGDEP